ncbi:hypothetical protein SAMN05216358_3757 [Rhizobium sp. AN5]|nr:hypothetical protein SAMN05216358_3757 [Rhizobium sp. AN5]
MWLGMVVVTLLAQPQLEQTRTLRLSSEVAPILLREMGRFRLQRTLEPNLPAVFSALDMQLEWLRYCSCCARRTNVGLQFNSESSHPVVIFFNALGDAFVNS